MNPHAPAKLNRQTYKEACQWFVEFRAGEPDESSRRAFRAWLQESPAHMGAYLDVAANWSQVSSIDLSVRWPIERLIAEASKDTEVVAMHPAAYTTAPPTASTTAPPAASTTEFGASTIQYPSASTARSPPTNPVATGPVEAATSDVGQTASARKTMRFALAAGIAAASMLIAWWKIPTTYSTGTGEQHSVVLRDGSTLNLNSRSTVRIQYSSHERVVDLLEGQALFEVAQDAARPFVVRTGSTQVRAIGTEFDVYRKTTGTVVTVLEGRVGVESQGLRGSDNGGSLRSPQSSLNAVTSTTRPSAQTPAPKRAAATGRTELLLLAGEQLTITPRTAVKSAPANLAAATAWTQRRLVFDSTPLSEVAEEFNRYNQRQLVVRDSTLNSFQIDGVFSSTDPMALIRFLSDRPEMKVTETDSEIIITQK